MGRGCAKGDPGWSVNFFRASGHTPLSPFLKRICQTEKGNFLKKTFEFSRKSYMFFFLLTLSFGMTKSASQCVNLERVIARSEKLRFRSALVSHSGQIFCSFLWHPARTLRKLQRLATWVKNRYILL